LNLIKLIIPILLFSGCQKVRSENTIHVWHQMLYENRKLLREVCDEYESKNPNLKIQLTYRETEELRSTFQAAAMGGSGPELIYYPSDQVGTFATMGLLKSLDSEFDSTFFNQFADEAIISFKNKKWLVGDVVGNNLMLIYNKDFIDNPPQNTDELIRIGKENTIDLNNDGKIDRYGLVWNYTEPYFYVPWIGGFGDWLIKNDNEPNLNTSANIAGFNFIKSLRDEHKIVPVECDYETANAMFKTGSAAMIINGDWSLGDYSGIVNYDIAPLPKVSQTGYWPSPMVSTKGYSINKNTKGKKLEETKRLLEYLVSTELQINFAKKLNIIPSSHEAVREISNLGNPIIEKLSYIISLGKPMPVVPEIRAIWDALRVQYQALLGGTISPETAARESQKGAEIQIKAMNEIIEPGLQGTIFKFGLPIFCFILILLFRNSFAELFQNMSANPIAYVFFLPAMIGIFSVIIFPFFYNVLISISNFSLNTFNNWEIIGLHHYLQVFSDSKIYSVLFKTVLWTGINIGFHLFLGVSLALLINRTLPAKPLMRTLLILPWAIPQYISALTWRGMFNQEYGSINIALNQLFSLNPIQWLSQPFEAFTACILTNIWLGFPFIMVITLGGLQSIPKELYEAAKVDGANRFQQLRSITLPMLIPILTPAIILGIIWTFNNINVVWLVSNGGEPSDSTHILVSYVYKAAFNLYRYGYAASLSMVIFIILLIFGRKIIISTEIAK
tara:strand:+ start:257 stop:2446 length:2190 start_codon:yes stop_codon:yes gene_type:complete